MRQPGRDLHEQPVVIDVTDRPDADLRALCLRVLHDLATSESHAEPVTVR